MKILKLTIETDNAFHILEGEEAGRFIKEPDKKYHWKVVQKCDLDLPLKPDYFSAWGKKVFGVPECETKRSKA